LPFGKKQSEDASPTRKNGQLIFDNLTLHATLGTTVTGWKPMLLCSWA
jgi:hypothetical protein